MADSTANDTPVSSKTPRRKPWYRLRNITFALCAALSLTAAWVIWQTLAVYYGKPVIRVDYRAQLQKMCEDAQPPGENAWPLLLEAAELTRQCVADVNAQDWPMREKDAHAGVDLNFILHSRGVPDGAERELELLTLMSERGVFDLVARASKMSMAAEKIENGEFLFNREMRGLSQLRLIAKANAVRMRLAAHHGQAADVVEPFEQILILGRHTSFQPALIEWLLGVAQQQLGREELQHELVDYEFDAATCQRLINVLNKCGEPAPLELAIESERVALLDVIQRCFSDDGHGDGYLLPNELIKLGNAVNASAGIDAAFRSRFFLAGRAESTSVLNAFFEGPLDMAQTTLSTEWDSGSGEVEDRIASRRFTLVAVLAPAIGKTVQTDTMTGVLNEGTKIMIALEQFHAQHRAYPMALEDLVPDILAGLPLDPICSDTFGYRVLSDDPHHRPYLLYSFGLDRQDNGGRTLTSLHEEQEMGALTNPGYRGYDYVLNWPRLDD